MAKTIFVTLCLLAVVLSARIIQSDATHESSDAPALEIPADSIAGVSANIGYSPLHLK